MPEKTRQEIDNEKRHKGRPDLVPATAILRCGEVMGYGFRKHGDCTWRKEGTEQADVKTHLASAVRHLLERLEDSEAVEEGSGMPVLWHCMAQIAIAIDLDERAKDVAFAETAAAHLLGTVAPGDLGFRCPDTGALCAAGCSFGTMCASAKRRLDGLRGLADRESARPVPRRNHGTGAGCP